MKNNWKEKAETLATLYLEYSDEYSTEFNNCVNAILKGMDLVFEATKKECADKAEMTGVAYGDSTAITDYVIDKESILNINKPNL